MIKKRDSPKRKEMKKEKVEMKCPHCGSKMKYRGPGDSIGSRYWKCRNKGCGRTVWKRADPPKEVIPIVYERKVQNNNERIR